MKVLACGDIHLTNYSMFNKPTKVTGIGSRLDYILKALKYFFSYGKKHQIKTYIINGDFFDKRHSDNPSVLAYIQDQFIGMYQDITPEGSVLLINVGNHEELSRVPYPNSISNFTKYSDTNHHLIKVFDEVGVWNQDGDKNDDMLMFIPYTEKVKEQKEQIKEMLTKYDKLSKHITVFAHLGVDGAVQGRWNHRLSDAYNLDDLGWNDNNVKSIVLNHFHTRSCLYPNIQGKLSLPSDVPSKHNQISKRILDLIEYGLNTRQITVNFSQGKVNGRPVYVNANGYAMTSLKDRNNNYHSVGVATIIAFVKYGKDNLLGKQVDHINNKHSINDNYPSNLQILSSRENLEKEMTDNNRRIPCKALNYFTHTEVHAQSIYELSLRTRTATSSISKCIHNDANVAGDFLVARESDDYRRDISFNHFSVQGKNISTGKLTPIFSSVSKAEAWLNISRGCGHIGEVCRGIHKQTKGYTWWYVSSHPEAYYIGDLTELNFNDIQEDGTGAPRGFEEIDTITGEHKLIDLTKEPYNIPTFNQIDLDEGSNLGLSTLNSNNYYKITTKDKETYEHLSKERETLESASNIQLVLIPQQIETQLDIDPTSSDKELVSNYCEKNYPELKDKALDYLRRARES